MYNKHFMDLLEIQEYTIDFINSLIENEVEENIHLDYKASGALGKKDEKKFEIVKDVSAFANSDGGILIYGLTEENHKPKDIDFVDGNVFTKEWMENIIHQIQPHIDGITIHPIRENGNIGHSIYVVKVPRSDKAPHMARDHRYYKRFNFKSEPMEDYEVKDILHRKYSPALQIVNGTLQDENVREGDKVVTFAFKAWIRNIGKVISKDYKFSASFFNLPKGTSGNYQPSEGKVLSMYVCEYCWKMTSPSKEPLFPGELIETGHYNILIPIETSPDDIWGKVYIKMTLLYEDGGKDTMLVNLDENNKVELFDEEEISAYIKKDLPDFSMADIL